MTYKLEILINFPLTTFEYGGNPTHTAGGEAAALLALAGWWDTGTHASLRLTSADGTKTVLGLYPSANA